MDFRVEICMIANSLDNLELLIKTLQKKLSLPIRLTKSFYASGKDLNTNWYYTTASCDCDSMPSYDDYEWEAVFKECADLVGTNGAIIASASDENLARDMGKDITKSEHLATTPKGKMLIYDTNFILDTFADSELDYLSIPHGYEKFKRAFIRAYGDCGKEIFRIYDYINDPIKKSSITVIDALEQKRQSLLKDDPYGYSRHGDIANRTDAGINEQYKKYWTPNPQIVFPGKAFTFSHMVWSKDEPIVKAVTAKGGIFKYKVSRFANYLVAESIETVSESELLYAAELIDKGYDLQIISVKDLIDALKNAN